MVASDAQKQSPGTDVLVRGEYKTGRAAGRFIFLLWPVVSEKIDRRAKKPSIKRLSARIEKNFRLTSPATW